MKLKTILQTLETKQYHGVVNIVIVAFLIWEDISTNQL